MNYKTQIVHACSERNEDTIFFYGGSRKYQSVIKR